MRLLSALLLLALSPSLAAQENRVAEPLSPYATAYAPLSSEAQGVAEAGAFGRTSDPLRMLDNPALLADLADGISVSGELTPEWFGFGDLSTRALAVAGGVRTSVAGRPASVAVGLAYGSFDSFEYVLTDDQGNGIGEFDSGPDRTFALGVGGTVDGPVRLRVGASARRYVSSAYPTTRVDSDRATALTADLGIDVTAPIGRWIMPTPDGGFQLVTDLTAGYALRGIGLAESSVDYGSDILGFDQSIPGRADRTPSAGITLLVGFDAGLGTEHALRGASLEFMTTAEAPNRASWDLSVPNVLLGVGDEFGRNIVRRGYRLTLAEVLTLSAGTMRGASFLERQSRGATLSLGGALRLAGMLGAGDGLSEMGRRIDLGYTYAAYTFEDDSFFGRSPSHGLTLRVNR